MLKRKNLIKKIITKSTTQTIFDRSRCVTADSNANAHILELVQMQIQLEFSLPLFSLPLNARHL